MTDTQQDRERVDVDVFEMRAHAYALRTGVKGAAMQYLEKARVLVLATRLEVAADELERLRAENARLTGEIIRLRTENVRVWNERDAELATLRARNAELERKAADSMLWTARAAATTAVIEMRQQLLTNNGLPSADWCSDFVDKLFPLPSDTQTPATLEKRIGRTDAD